LGRVIKEPQLLIQQCEQLAPALGIEPFGLAMGKVMFHKSLAGEQTTTADDIHSRFERLTEHVAQIFV
jgi:hypothetical protein